MKSKSTTMTLIFTVMLIVIVLLSLRDFSNKSTADKEKFTVEEKTECVSAVCVTTKIGESCWETRPEFALIITSKEQHSHGAKRITVISTGERCSD